MPALQIHVCTWGGVGGGWCIISGCADWEQHNVPHNPVLPQFWRLPRVTTVFTGFVVSVVTVALFFYI